MKKRRLKLVSCHFSIADDSIMLVKWCVKQRMTAQWWKQLKKSIGKSGFVVADAR